MSLYGMMRTGVSGMNAQANRLSTTADNIANSDTTGYKRSSAEFSTLIMPQVGGAYNSGGVTTTIRSAISAPGRAAVHDLGLRPCGQRQRLLRRPGPERHAFPHPRRRLRSRRPGQAGQRRRLPADGLQLRQRHTCRHRQRLRRAGAGPDLRPGNDGDAQHHGQLQRQSAGRRRRRPAGPPAVDQQRRPRSTRRNPRWSPTTISATRSCSTSISPTPAPAPGRSRSSTSPRRRPAHPSPIRAARWPRPT